MSKSNAQADPLTQFSALTGASPDVARHTLEACNWDLQRAVNLFIDNQQPGPVAPKQSTSKNNSKLPASSGKQLPTDGNVRAPIAPTKEVLIQDYSSRGSSATFAGSLWRNPLGASGQASPGISTDSRLAQLFSPPAALLFAGTFESAKREATKQAKWLLVNIQMQREFACLVLNRDVWSHRDVQTLLKERFLFWQSSSYSAEARQYVNLYRVEEFPHVALLDPRTGEKVLTLTQPLTAKEFLKQVSAFLATHPSLSATGSSTADDASPMTAKSRRMLEQSEEEQIKGALEASLKAAQSTGKSNGGQQTGTTKNTSGLFPTGSWKEYLGTEGTVQILLALRAPDGKQHRVAFPSGTKLKALLLYVVEVLGLGTKPFELHRQYPKKCLTDCDPMVTLEQLGLMTRDTLYVHRK